MSSSRTSGFFAAVAVLLLAASPAAAQFGQNKIAYDRFDWQVYPSQHFDIYHYGAQQIFLEDIVSHAESAYLKLSTDLDHELKFRVPLVIYKTHAEFEQTNITLGAIGEGTGAFAEPVQNRMVLPIDMPPDELYALISHELTHIFEFSLFFEGNLGRALRGRPPQWLMEGLASYLGDDEDNLDRMIIRDAVVNNVLPPVEALDFLPTFLTYRYGHALFAFIASEFGEEGLRTFLFEYRRVLLANNAQKAIKETFGWEPDEFNRRFNRYLRKKYFPVLLEKKGPDDYGKEIRSRKRGVYTLSPAISPSGELVAAIDYSRRPGEMDLVVVSAEDGSRVRNLTKGYTNKYEYLVVSPLFGKEKRDVSWSPTGDEIAVFVRKENARPLYVFNALNGKLVKRIDLPGLAQTASPAFSPDGTKIAFEGNLDGVVDIFEIDLETREIRNVTQDDFFDTNPWYASDGKTILYNRRIGSHWKVFTVDLSDPSRKRQLTFGPHSDAQPSFSRDGGTVYFASDRGPYGVFNIHSLDLATGEVRQYTDVVGGCFAPVEMAGRGDDRVLVFAAFFEGSYRLYRMPLRQAEATIPAEEIASQPIEAEPFEPPLNLSVDASKITPYKLRWDIEAPFVSVGVTDDGTFLTNAAIQFADLMGDHRIQFVAATVSDFANANLSYVNMKRRTRWGASIFDYRDYFLEIDQAGADREQVQRTSGATFSLAYPFSRYYRVQGSFGLVDRSQDYLVTDPSLPGGFGFSKVRDRYATVGVSFVGDTTRYMGPWVPKQGKRFSIGVIYGANLSADGGGVISDSSLEGDIIQYAVDFRTYKQLTRRSLIAWRLAGIINAGDRESFYGFGGINQLRGYEYREFFGSRVAWSNFELRFPLVDELRFPFGPFRNIRGFMFVDVGAAWLADDEWWDPVLQSVRVNPATNRTVPFKFWDSENNRLQDGRASYGVGFQLFFLGGLQFNWSWAHRVDYMQYDPSPDPANPGSPIGFVEADPGKTRMDFYIVFDF